MSDSTLSGLSQPEPTPAGWHPAPDRPGQLRYWNGQTWTDHYAPGAQLEVRPARPVVVSDQRVSGSMTLVAWVVAILTLGYMLPWAIAETRGKSNSMAIGLVNFLLGWTAIGWVVALVMACGAHQKVAA